MTPVVRLPPHGPGMRIGLLGGSFNPPHEGHALVTRIVLTRLRLDRVWWLVTPGNPLKSQAELAALQARVAAARRLVSDPRVEVTDIEAHIGARYTYDTLEWLTRRAPSVRFVWVMGADNLRQFDRWRRWRGHRRACPDCRGGPAGIDPQRPVGPRGERAFPVARSGKRGGDPRGPEAARLPVPSRAALRTLLDAAAAGGAGRGLRLSQTRRGRSDFSGG